METFYKYIDEHTVTPFTGSVLRFYDENGRLRKKVCNPRESDLREAGYKPVATSETPQREGYHYTPIFVDGETEITQEWEEHLLPEPDPETETETEEHAAARLAAELASAKAAKIAGLTAFDAEESPEGVNYFYLGEQGMWLSRETRNDVQGRLDRANKLGNTTIILWYDTTPFTIPVSIAEELLFALCNYADECYDVTAAHKAAINALTTVEEVEAYDYHTGYPDKLHFDL